MTHVILTAVGSDRPGLVEEVSEFIFARGGNIEDSRMVHLRGQFAMILLIAGDEMVLSKIGADLGQIANQVKLHAELHPADAARPLATQSMPYRLTATAMDQAGLVHRVAHVLREMNVNIESMDTHLAPAPITGAPVFDMELTLAIPRTTQISKLRESLGKLCDELNLDWQLQAV